jgi:hypothetical protein
VLNNIKSFKTLKMKKLNKKTIIENMKIDELETRLEFKQWIKLPEPCLCVDCDCKTDTSIFDVV